MNNEGLQYSKFVVDERPHCIWAEDLDESNRVLIDNLDADYFAFQARTLAPLLEGEDRLRAAVALRSSYSHALESFFALLFAALQAPDCVPAWLSRYSLADLRSLVGKVNAHKSFKSKLPIPSADWDRRWSGVAAALFPISEAYPEQLKVVRRDVARMWARFARDFLDEHQSAEYNWIKHGMRVATGGFVLRMGPQPALNVPPPEEAMRTVGASAYGCTTYQPEPIKDAPNHFRYRETSSNWEPQNHIAALKAVSVFVHNLKVLLRMANRYDGEYMFTIPEEPAFYTDPWRQSVGVSRSSHATKIEKDDIGLFSRDEIFAEYTPREP